MINEKEYSEEDFNNDILIINSKINERENAVSKTTNHLIDLLSFKSHTPLISFLSDSIKFSFKNIIDLNIDCDKYDLYLNIYVKNNNIKIKHNILSVDTNPQLDSLSLFLNESAAIIDSINKIDMQLIIDFINNINNLNNEIVRLREDINELTCNYKEHQLKGKINKIYSIIKPINQFCIHSFLCEKLGIDFVNKPSKDNIQELKNKIIDDKSIHRQLENHLFLTFSFNFPAGCIIINENQLSLEIKPNRKLNITLSGNDKAKNIKNVNLVLSEQFTVNNVLIKSLSEMKKITPNIQYYNKIEEFINEITPLLLEKKIETF